jgi:hypothetical protein
MATDPAEIPTAAAGESARPVAPLAGNRSQSMQRLQIGLFGLAAMILLVSLASIIDKNARENEARVVPEAAPTVASEAKGAPASDPLADAGVVPDMPDASRSRGTGPEQADDAPALQP